MTIFELKEKISDKKYITENFYRNNRLAEEKVFWGITVKAAGSMRFRWNEKNSLRDSMLSKIAGHRQIAAVQLEHTKLVYDITEKDELDNKIGDGIITLNNNLMPVVTVADCMPLFFSDNESGFFGLVHSGWKGTGIAEEALNLAVKKYKARRENISVAIGPHIRNCCYVVNQERAEYFAKNFTEACVEKIKDGESVCGNLLSSWDNGSGPLYRLSLEKANLAVLEHCGIRDENIVIAKDCTCCNELFGSNRRETSLGKTFTVQAAFVIHQ